MKKTLTDEEKINLVNLYLDGTSIKELSEIFNRAESSVRDLIKRRGIKLRPLTEVNRKFEIYENFFDVINTDEKAYFLGFLYADGNVKTNKNMVVLALKESDREILERLNKLIHIDKPLYLDKNKRGGNRENIVGIRICNKNITNKLIQYGCHPNKTFTLSFPNFLDKKLYNSFIRGYFDGDGYIGMIRDSRKDKYGVKYNKFYHKFTLTGNGLFLRAVANIFKELLNVNSSFEIRHKDRSNDIVSLTVKGNTQIERIYDFLYSDSNLFLNRKHIIFKQIKK
jgi:predicted DNA-binding protein YlxM (UPF0122 family)